MSIALKFCGGALAWILLSSSLAKLLSENAHVAPVGVVLNYVMAVAELMAAISLATRRARFGIVLSIAIALGGVGMSAAGLDATQACGCLGDVLLERRGHLLLAAGLGLSASLYWWLQERAATVAPGIGLGAA